MQPSPTIEGFRAMFRQPSLGLGEIAWRWSFGGGAALLFGFSFLEYLHTLPVSARDLFLLRTGQPTLVSQALAHILRGSGTRAAYALLVLGAALALAWMAIAALGRAAITNAVLEHLLLQDEMDVRNSWRLRGLLGLNFFRVAAALAAAIGFLAAWVLAGAASSASDPSPGSALLIFLTVLMLVSVAWVPVNWFLSFASIFPVTEGDSTLSALGAAGDLCRARLGSVAAVSFWFGLAHIVVFMIASSVVAFPLAFAALLPAGVVLGGVLLVTLLYFALTDFLYVGRLAAYIRIAQLPEAPAPPQLVDQPGGAPRSATAEEPAAIDREELIISDV